MDKVLENYTSALLKHREAFKAFQQAVKDIRTTEELLKKTEKARDKYEDALSKKTALSQ